MVELREPLEELIHSPRQFTSDTAFPRANEIRLYDTILPDGEQTPGVAFSPEQKSVPAITTSTAWASRKTIWSPTPWCSDPN